jgi:hypothetical protein
MFLTCRLIVTVKCSKYHCLFSLKKKNTATKMQSFRPVYCWCWLATNAKCKRKQILGSALWQSRIKQNHFIFLQTLCDRPQDHSHLVRDMFIDIGTTLLLKGGLCVCIMCVIHRQNSGRQLMGQSFPRSHTGTAGMQQKWRGTGTLQACLTTSTEDQNHRTVKTMHREFAYF